MSAEASVVITGLGVVSPLGLGYQAAWDSLLARRTGLRRITQFDPAHLRSSIAGEVVDFDPAEYVKPRKSLKVMARDAQFTVAAAGMARDHAALGVEQVDPERFGVLFGGGVIRSPLEVVAAPYAACRGAPVMPDTDATNVIDPPCSAMALAPYCMARNAWRRLMSKCQFHSSSV